MSKAENCYPEVHQHIKSHLVELDESLKTQEYINFDLSPIYAEISPETKTFLSEINIDTQKKYLYCLSNVARWKNHIFNNIADNLEDNDYEHVLEMLKINTKIKELNISSINHSEVELMTIIHDGGEIITSDMSSNQPDCNYNFVKNIKKMEPKVFCGFVLKQLENDRQKKSLTSLYEKYEHRQADPKDINSHLVKMIDILQGNNFGLENVYKREIVTSVYPEQLYTEKLNQIVENMIIKWIDQTKIVMDCLDNFEDKVKIYQFSLEHFTKYPETGHQNILDKFETEIKSLDPSAKSFRTSLQ